ncbi:MAG: SGNH/GDSL hydrolase family protein [Mycobacteriales bacterium]
MNGQVIALGDSFSCGQGVGLHVPPAQTWVGRLATALDAELVCLAQAGATVAAVRRRQLPRVPPGDDVATLLVGLNDVTRGGFDPAGLLVDLAAVVTGLRTAGHRVLLGRLRDPCLMLPLATPLRRWIGARVDAVNQAVDRAATGDPGVSVLDLGTLPDLHSRAAWDTDRLHPSPWGNACIAAAAAAVLTAPVPVPTVDVPAPPRVHQEAYWALRHGLPWALGKASPAGRYLMRQGLVGGVTRR